jgi:tetratricopeptide (TPR) repeat protein
MIRWSILTLLFLAIASDVAAEEKLPVEYESKRNGFALRLPQGWLGKPTENPTTGFRVLFGDPAAPGVGVLVQSRRADAERSPEAIRTKEIEGIRGRADIESPKPFTASIAGRKSPGLELLITQQGKQYRMRRLYLVHQEREIVFQWHAPVGEFAGHGKLLDRIRTSFRLVDVAKADPVDVLAARCGSELPWADSWADAAAKVRKQRRPVLVYVRRLGGFAISDPAMAGLFMDADVAALIEERFVPLVFRKSDRAPFQSPEVYGLGPSTFGSALLVVTPEGEVLATTAALETFSAFTFLRETLLRHPKLDGNPPRSATRPETRAERLLRRGEDERALEVLGDADSADAHRIRAAILRRKRDGTAALAALDAARAAGLPEADFHLDRSRVLLRMGRFDEATRSLKKIPKTSDDRPQAMFWLGVLAYRTTGLDPAKKLWNALVTEHPESRWAWRAAALLRSTILELGIKGRLRWPSDAFIRELTRPIPESRPVAEAVEARREALEALLRLQQKDGSFVCPVVVGRAAGERPHEFAVAVTALCATSLLPDRKKPRVATALRRAEEWLKNAHRHWQRDPPPALFMDYTVWSHATNLRYLAASVQCGFLPKRPSMALAAERMAELFKRQRPGGGFSYYISQDPRSNARDTQSISFVTGYVALALLDAKDAGFAVPAARVRQCQAALGAMLNPNGTFSYMKPAGVRTPDATKEPGAAGRGPYCALALFRGGLADLDLVRKTVALYVKHREGLGRERRKALMHTGSDAQGSHYIMFDYAMIAQAIAVLPEAERKIPRTVLLEEILAARLDDGSYLDNPFLGRAFGAAMALSAFESLGVGR